MISPKLRGPDKGNHGAFTLMVGTNPELKLKMTEEEYKTNELKYRFC